jgi:hypothetical protein
MSQSIPHKWAKPPAGQGGATERVCTVCGGRRSVMGESSSCTGTGRDVTIETRHEYDPYE